MVAVDAAKDARILVHAPTGRDASLAAHALARAGWDAFPCPTIQRLCEEATAGAAAMIIAEESLTGAAHSALATWVAAQPTWSDLPILILTSVQQSSLAVAASLEMLSPLGNVTILERPMRAVVLLTAVSAAKRARERQYEARDLLVRLEHALDDRDAFIATLSHELRNPLAAIRNALELVDPPPPANGQGNPLAVVRRQSLHVSRLVDDLLDVARITSGKIVLQPASVDLVEIVRRGVETIQIAENDDHDIRLHLPDRSVVVHGDPVRLEQVVVNLLTNAVKYTPRRGRIDVEVGSDGGAASLKVRDQGEGLSPAMQANVFQMFSQAERTLARARGGLGIGLTVTRRLVELHGGEIEVNSPGEGKGTTFVVRLPLWSPPAEGESPREVSGSHAPTRATIHSVVLVEDNDDIRDTLAALLARQGFAVDVAHDGPSGVEAALSRRPDAVVVDIGLPGFDGYEVARRLRAGLPATTVLIALSGYGQPEDRRKSQDAGFDTHLTKPVDIHVLAVALAGLGAGGNDRARRRVQRRRFDQRSLRRTGHPPTPWGAPHQARYPDVAATAGAAVLSPFFATFRFPSPSWIR